MSKKSKCEATDRETTTSTSNWNPSVGSLIPEDRTLVKVSPNAKLEEAITLMLANNYSQLPVMEGDRKVNGAISWKSIGSSKVTNMEVTEVRRCIGKCQIAKSTDSVFEVAHLIAEHDFVLVKDTSDIITGIVTASDLTSLFRELYEPFYLTGSVELNMRQIAQHANFDSCDFDDTNMNNKLSNENMEGLSLGQINRLIGPKENWRKLNLKNVDRNGFRKYLCKVIDIRNDVMHFRTHDLSVEKKSFLRSFSEFVEVLANSTKAI